MKTAGQPPADLTAANTLGSLREAESLFRSKSIHEIRTVEASTRLDIEQKKEELRQLVGKSYRDLIDSADSIIQMKSSCESIASNLSRIDAALRLLSPSSTESPHIAPDPARRAKIYGIACRVKYLVDTPENIWGCLDESMLLEASGRYLRAKEVHGLLSKTSATPDVLSRFPLLQHQWQIVESFKAQISQRSRDRLMDRGLSVAAYADALAAAATIDDLNPKQVLDVFLDSRRAWISQKLVGTAAADDGPDSSLAVLCDVVKVIRASLGQVGQLLRHALSEMPLFYKLVLGSPPGSQLFGGIPNPEDEVKLWKLHREKLESVMVLLEPEFISQACSSWLESCCDEIFAKSISGKGLIRSILSGEGLVAAEKMVREALDARDGLEISLEEWLRDVFGSDINSPWKQICGLILKDGKDILEDRMEQAFLLRMKEIVQSGFEDLTKVVSIKGSIEAIVAGPNGANDFYEYLKISSKGGGVWFSELSQKRMGLAYNLKPSADENDFRTCLNAFFGPEVCRIRDLIDNKLWSILDDLLCFVESHNSTLRLKELAPHIQDKCYNSMSAFLEEIHGEMNAPSVSLINNRTDNQFQPSPVIVERSLFLARLLYALRNHSSHISLILGSPRQWAKETIVTTYASLASPLSKQYKGTLNSPQPFSPRRPAYDILPSPGRQSLETSKRQAFSAAAALLTVDNCTNLKHEKLSRNLQNLCIKAHNLWISWVSNELSIILSKNLNHDNALSVSNPLRGWEVTVIKQEEPAEGHLEMQIVLPSMASQYIISFLFQACQEIHKAGGHILNKVILQNFASEMLKKVIGVYENFLALVEAPESRVSEKGVLQILFDLRFSADVLSGGNDTNSKPLLSLNSNLMEICSGLIHRFSLKLDPIDWATYEPYLWENEKQSYKRCSVLFGFFIQLNRLYIDTVQKLPTKTNTESNILRCSAVPRFKYLPISAPALSSRGSHKSAAQMSMDDASTKTPWKAYSNGEQSPKLDFDDSSSFGAAAPLLKSFMTQVGSKFGESTSKWGMMLSDGKLKDRSAAAMSTFGDMLPGPAAGLLSSLTSGSRFDSL